MTGEEARDDNEGRDMTLRYQMRTHYELVQIDG